MDDKSKNELNDSVNDGVNSVEDKPEGSLTGQGPQSQDQEQETGKEQLPPLTFWEVIQGVFAMAIGVRSQERRIQDFSRGKFIHFAIAGVIFGLCFILIIATIVVLILS